MLKLDKWVILGPKVNTLNSFVWICSLGCSEIVLDDRDLNVTKVTVKSKSDF